MVLMDPSLRNHSIVVGVDGSTNSVAALDWAVAEAQRRDMALHLYSAGMRRYTGGEAMVTSPKPLQAVTNEAQGAADVVLSDAADRTRDQAPGLIVTMQRGLDYPAGALVVLQL